MTDTKELRDLLARALGDLPFDADGSRNSDAAVAAALSIVQPMLDAAYARGREDAALIADDHCLTADDDLQRAYTQAAIDIAAAIRAETTEGEADNG